MFGCHLIKHERKYDSHSLQKALGLLVCSHSFTAHRFNRNATLGRRLAQASAPAICLIYVEHICLEPLAGLDWVRQLYPQGTQEPIARRQQRYRRPRVRAAQRSVRHSTSSENSLIWGENIMAEFYLSKFLMDAGGEVSNYEKRHSSYRNSKDPSSVRKISSGWGTGSILGTETKTAGRTNHSRPQLSATKTRGL